MKNSAPKRKRFSPIAYAISSAILNRALLSISILETFLMIWNMSIMRAGPEQSADAMNLGARIDAFQKGLADRPL